MIVFMIAYVAVLVGIAVYSSRRVSSGEDFLLAGRRMGPWMTAFAYGTSYFSAVVFIGYAGQFGWGFGASATWIGIGNAVIGSLLAWLVLGRRTRSMTQRLDAKTMPEFLENRYQAPKLKLVAAVVVFAFLLPYSASVFQGISYLFETLIGLPFIWCVVGIVVLTGVYLVAGGYLATALTDFFQGVIMLIGIALVVVFVLKSPQVGGLQAGLDKLAAIDSDLTHPWGGAGQLWPLASLVILTSLGVWGLPQMTHKFYAIRDKAAIRQGTIISTVFALIVSGGCYFVGVFARLFNSDPTQLPIDPATGLGNTSLLVPQMLLSALPSLLLGLVMVLVLSASMSTLSSLILVSSSAVCVDLVPGSMRAKLSQRKNKGLMQLVCIVFLILSFLLAINKSNTITQLMNLSWGTLAGAFLGPYLAGLYMKRATRAGAWAGFLGGLAVSLICNLIVPRFVPGFTSAMAGTFAMGASILLTVLVSLFTPPLDQAHVGYAMDFSQD